MKPAEWLPIPSNIPVPDVACPARTGGPKIGHFGTYGAAVVPLLEPVLVRLLGAGMDRITVLLGRGGPEFAAGFLTRNPALAGRVTAPGDLAPDTLVERLRECDLPVQPFIDGISTRRTSAMAGIANAVPVVSNLGEWSEQLWAEVDCVTISPRPDADEIAVAAEAVLALASERRDEPGRRAVALYRACFSLENTIRTLRATHQEAPR